MEQRTDEIYQALRTVRRHAAEYLTNLYLSPETIDQWISWGELDYLAYPGACLILRRLPEITQVYYAAADKAALQAALLRATDDHPSLNIDLLCKEEPGKTAAETEVFQQAGFSQYVVMRRMVRSEAESGSVKPEEAVFARADEADRIRLLLLRAMDQDADQIPSIPEIRMYIDRREAIVSRAPDSGDLASCILWTGHDQSTAWRYWAVDPAYEGTLLGLNLLNIYLEMQAGARVHTLFVRDGNPARQIYEFAGFQDDGLTDQVFLYRREEAG